MENLILQCLSVTKRYGDFTALNSVSLELNKGEFFGLLGPNGAGKSTLMNILIGYLKADEGSISVFSGGLPVADIRTITGYTPQALAVYDDLSALANLRIFSSFYGLTKKQADYSIAGVLEMAGLFDRKNDKVGTFSGGMKRRLNLAASLLHNPELIICDEPTVGVDPQSRNAIFEFLEKLNADGKTIIYTTHYMEEAERLCKRIGIIDGGNIIAVGTQNELLSSFPYKRIISGPASVLAEHSEAFNGYTVDVLSGERFEAKLTSDELMVEFLSKCSAAGVPLEKLDIRKPALESLFLQLTGRTLRD